MKKLKILQISWSLSSGGAERFVVDLCNRLAENPQLEIVLVTLCDDSLPGNKHYFNMVSDNVRYVNLGFHSGCSISSHLKFLKLIRREKPDVVHAHCGIQWLYLPALLLRKVRIVYTLHSMADVCLFSKRLKPVDKWLYSHRIRPVTISNTCEDSFVKLFGIHSAERITNGREPMVPSENRPADVSFLDGEKVPVFIHVARSHPAKNHKRLFHAFEQLQQEGVKFQLMVIGSGYENNWLPLFKDNPQIHILGERNNVAAYLVLADFFVLTSDYEGLPLSLLEAMSLGVIPICTPAGGIADVIRDGDNGFMTKGFSDEEFLAKTKEAIAKVSTMDRNRIIEDYRQHYSMQVCVNKYYHLYLK